MSDRASVSGEHPVVYCDTVASVGMHYGNARILLTRLDVSGRATTALEVILPNSEVKTLLAALQKVSR
jgi:hypothetical protein